MPVKIVLSDERHEGRYAMEIIVEKEQNKLEEEPSKATKKKSRRKDANRDELDNQIPRRWVERAGHDADPEMYRTNPHYIDDTIYLSITNDFFNIFFENDYFDRVEITEDLAAGFSLTQAGRNRTFYQMSSTKYVLAIHSREGRNTGAPLAVVTKIEYNKKLPRRSKLFEGNFCFSMIWDEAECDLAGLCETMQEVITFEQPLYRAIKSESAQEDLIHSKYLHSLVRKNYGTLQKLITLLAQKATVEQSGSVDGVVIAESALINDDQADAGLALADEDFTIVEITNAADLNAFEEDRIVEVTKTREDGKHATVRTRLAKSIKSEKVMYLRSQEKIQLCVGDQVLINAIPQFDMKHHAKALDAFMKQQIEGNWESLVRLLCDPQALSYETLTDEGIKLLSDRDSSRLESEQRKAVIGAVTTPDTFFIQGPPGTGKTTVISEIIRELTHKGERILLLAPTHVAVDEVLRRIGDAPGILPIRLSFDDSKIDKDLRRFGEAEARRELTRKIFAYKTKGAEWQSEIDTLEAELQPILEILQAREDVEYAQEKEQQHIKDYKNWQSDYLHSVSPLSSLLKAEDMRAANIQAEIDMQKTKVQTLEDDLFLRRQKQNIFGKAYSLLGFGKIPKLRSASLANKAILSDLEKVGEDSDRKVNSLGHKLHSNAIEAETIQARYSSLLEESRNIIGSAQLKYQAALNQWVTDNKNDEKQLQIDSDRLNRRINKLTSYIKLGKRWEEMQIASGNSKESFAGDIGDEILREANLVCSTSSGIGGSPSVRDVDFDTLILDESSRVTDSEFLIGAVMARRWILVGDEKQLPPYTEPKDEYHLHALAAIHMNEIGAANSLVDAVDTLSALWSEDDELHRFRKEAVIECADNINTSGAWEKNYRSTFIEAYAYFKSDGHDSDKIMLDAMRKYLVNSLFDRCVSNCLPGLKQKLLVQRRMIDPIAAIVRDSVYSGEYRSPEIAWLEQRGITPLTTAETFYRPITFLDTSLYGKEAAEGILTTGFINKLEQKWIIAVCKDYERELIEKDDEPITVSILCFYKAQALEIRRKLQMPNPPGFRKLKFNVVDSIDKVQGQESDLVIISFCRARVGKSKPSKGFGLWLQDLRRLNVACTRAHRAIVFVGHKTTLEGLCAITEAKLFYKNLFELFENNQDTMGIVKNYLGRRS